MDEKVAWDVYFSAVCGLKFHPRNKVDDVDKEVNEAAEIADVMLRYRRLRWPGQR